MITRPFDEAAYPRLHFSPQQLAVIALARQVAPRPIRTKTIARRFGWSENKTYKVLRRLRDKGVFRSQLVWITTTNGSHAARVEPDGTRRLFSWLELYLMPMDQWGREPDQVQSHFQPGRGETA
jgi:hypothetical protein